MKIVKKPFLHCNNREQLFINIHHQFLIGISGPPELPQLLHGILKSLVPTQRQAAGYLNVVKERLTLAVPLLNLENSTIIVNRFDKSVKCVTFFFHAVVQVLYLVKTEGAVKCK